MVQQDTLPESYTEKKDAPKTFKKKQLRLTLMEYCPACTKSQVKLSGEVCTYNPSTQAVKAGRSETQSFLATWQVQYQAVSKSKEKWRILSCGGAHLYSQNLGGRRQADLSSAPAWSTKFQNSYWLLHIETLSQKREISEGRQLFLTQRRQQ